jgi:hypothetical protein
MGRCTITCYIACYIISYRLCAFYSSALPTSAGRLPGGAGPRSSLRRFQVQCLCCPSLSIPHSFLTPLFSFYSSDMVWLTHAIPPHTDSEVELVPPTSVASPCAGISYSSMAVVNLIGQTANLIGQDGRDFSTNKALHPSQWHTTQHILTPAQV